MTNDNPQPRLVHAFPDANVFLHFTTFDEVDWPLLLDVDQVCLVLVPSVMRELDQFKDDGSNDWRKTRVRTILSKFKTLLRASIQGQPVEVRSGVTIQFLTREPELDWRTRGFDPQVPDDRLMASILTFTPESPGRIILITNDFPAQTKANSHGITAWEPEGVIDRVKQSSPKDKEIQQLRQRVQVLEHRLPILELAFQEDGKERQEAIRSRGSVQLGVATDEQIREELETHRQQFERNASSLMGWMDAERIDKYRRDCRTYLVDAWSFAIRSRARAHGHRLLFDFVLRNDSSTPAENVSVELRFPAGTFVVALGDEEDNQWGLGDIREPDYPNRPSGPPSTNWPYGPILTAPLPALTHLVRIEDNIRQAVARGPLYDEQDRTSVEFEIPKLRQKDYWEFDTLVAYVPIDRPGGFPVGCTIRADNLPEPIKKDLNVILKLQQ